MCACTNQPGTSVVLALLMLLSPSDLLQASEKEVFIVMGKCPKEVRDAVGSNLQELVGSELEPGSIVHFYKAPELDKLGTFRVPRGSRNARLLNQNLRPAWQNVLPFLKNKQPAQSTQVSLPRLPSIVRESRQTKFPVYVVIVGSILYDDPRYPAWKFNPHVPTHASLEAAYCPFTGGVKDFPAGTKISWIVPASEMQLDGNLLAEVTDFYRLFCRKHQAELVWLGKDTKAAFQFPSDFFEKPVIVSKHPAGVWNPSYKTVAAETSSEPETVTLRRVQFQSVDDQPVNQKVVAPKVNNSVEQQAPTPEKNQEPAPASSKATTSVIEVEVTPQPESKEHVVFLVDHSDSMKKSSDDVNLTWKYELHMEDLFHRIRTMEFGKFCVIGFSSYESTDGSVKNHFRHSQGSYRPEWATSSDKDREAACAAVERWGCNGGTPTLDALKRACDLNNITTVYFYTDGGGPDAKTAEVISLVKRMRRIGVTLHTVGVGSLADVAEEDVTFMRQLAAAGGGKYIGLK